MQEKKTKACKKKGAKVAYFERKEATMKIAKQNVDAWNLKKELVGSGQAFKKVAQANEVTTAAERKAKKKVEAEREQVEAAEKQQSNSEAESEQKVAMDKKERLINQLKF